MSALPQSLPLQLENIPEELIKIAQWVCWKFKPVKGRYTKTPINPKTGGLASTTSRKTWGTFEDALAGMARYGLPGIGFVFSEDDPYCGIDLDDCVNTASGRIDVWAREIIDQIDSYTEISPSGTGIKIFTRASLPLEGRRRTGNVEMYDYARFFTVTGHQLADSRDEIANRIKAVNHLYERLFPAGQDIPPPTRITALSDFSDQELIDRATAARNGQKFLQLYHGDTTGYDSQSEADLALCSMIAFWSGPDETQIDRIFRASGLYREKWEREGYRTGTITAALDRTEFWEPETTTTFDPQSLADAVKPVVQPEDHNESQLPYIIDVADLLKEPDEPEVWLVDNIWRDATVGLIVGPPKTFKSFFVQELSVAVATGMPMFGLFHVSKTAPVVYVQEESARRYVRKRYAGILKGHGLHPESVRGNLFTVTNQHFRLDDPEHIRRLVTDAIEAYSPSLVILDPLREMHWQDENKAETMMPLLRVLKDLRDTYGISIAVVHHNNKNPEYKNPAESIRGSTAIWAAMDAGIFISTTDTENRMKVSITLKEGGQVEPFLYSIASDEDAINFEVVELDGSKHRQTTISHVVEFALSHGGWWSIEEAVSALPTSERTTRTLIREAVRTRQIQEMTAKFGKKLYAHPEVDNDEPTF